jgi:hypothetical protein
MMKQGFRFLYRFASTFALVVLITGCVFTALTLVVHPPTAHASSNGLANKPLLGWSSWSSIRSSPTEAKIEAQAQAMSTTLKSHGYTYINMDDFWYLNPSTTVDQYGRWVPDSSKFPDGIAGLASYIHGLGLKFGIYLTPGIPVAAVKQNTPIQGTSYHAQDIADTSKYETNYNYGSGIMYYINYSKPGAQEFVNSWANQLAGWGVDFLKIDGVGDNDIGDIQAWNKALQQSGRQIYFHLSNSLDINNVNTWRANSNGWRISGDVECYCSTLVTWGSVSSRFNQAPKWVAWGGPGGWNDLDSLDVGNGSKDGLTNDERQSVMTLWSISAAPLYVGDDLTTLDSYGQSLLTNDEVLAIDQSGVVGAPLVPNATTQVWRAYQSDGSYAVALFNLGSTSATVTVNWGDLGFAGAASVRDLWSRSNLGNFSNSFSATLNSHASRLLKIIPASPNAAPSYEAEAASNTLSGGARVLSCSGCSGGSTVGYVGNGGTLTFNNISANATGAYALTIAYASGEDRYATMSVNGGAGSLLRFASTGSFTTVSKLVVTVNLNAGNNTIAFSNASGWAPDFDRITLPPRLNLTFYEAEASSNTIAGGASISSCTGCSGGKKVGYVGNGGTLTFNGINTSSAGTHTLVIYYLDGDGGRAANLSINGGSATALNFPGTNGGDWNTVYTYSVTVNLNAGNNTIAFANSAAYAPDFDRIGIA